MDDLQALTAAIAEVVTAPYPVSLSNVRRILSQTSRCELNLWCVIKSCQVKSLLANLIHRLKYGEEDAFHCLADFLQCNGVRAELYEDRSILIGTFCQLLEHNETSLSSLHICSAIVGFASESPVPEVLVNTIDRHLESEGVLLDTTSISDSAAVNILGFVSTTPVRLLSQLRESTIATCMKSWKHLLRSDRHQFAVAAVHVAHRLASFKRDALLGSNRANGTAVVPIPGNLSLWIEKCATLFDGIKATNVLDTMVLVVLKACSQEHDMLDTVEKCQEVICGTDSLVLHSWVGTHASVVTKITRKCLETQDLRLQSAVFCILSGFALGEQQNHMLPRLCHSILSKLTHNNKAGFLEMKQNCSILAKILEQLVPSMNTTFATEPAPDTYSNSLRQLIVWMMEWCAPGVTAIPYNYCSIELAVAVVDGLLLHVDKHPDVAGLIVDVLLKAGFGPDWWSLDLATPGSPLNCTSSPVCLHRLEERRQHLCSLASFLLLQAASTSSKMVRRDVFHRLRQQITSAQRPESAPCCHYPASSPAFGHSMRMFESPDLRSKWRQSLRQHMLDDNRQTWDKVESVILQVCKDLQHRCDNVEKPLRVAQDAVSELTTKVNNGEQQLGESRTEALRLMRAMEDETAAKEDYSCQAERLRVELASLQGRVEDYRHRMSEAKQVIQLAKESHEQSIAECKAAAESQATELQQAHALRLSELEDQLRSQMQAESSLESENAWLREEMHRVDEEATSRHATAMTALQEEHMSARDALQQQITSLESQTLKAQRLATEEKDVSQQLSAELSKMQREAVCRKQLLEDRDNTVIGLRAKLEAAHDRSAELEKRLQDSEAHQKSVKSALQKQCRTQAKALDCAKKAEQRVLAIFQGHEQPVPSSAGTTVTITPSQVRRVSARQMPEFSLVSEDDQDYSEMLKAT